MAAGLSPTFLNAILMHRQGFWHLPMKGLVETCRKLMAVLDTPCCRRLCLVSRPQKPSHILKVRCAGTQRRKKFRHVPMARLQP